MYNLGSGGNSRFKGEKRQQCVIGLWLPVQFREGSEQCYLLGCDDGNINWKSTAHVPSCSW